MIGANRKIPKVKAFSTCKGEDCYRRIYPKRKYTFLFDYDGFMRRVYLNKFFIKTK